MIICRVGSLINYKYVVVKRLVCNSFFATYCTLESFILVGHDI